MLETLLKCKQVFCTLQTYLATYNTTFSYINPPVYLIIVFCYWLINDNIYYKQLFAVVFSQSRLYACVNKFFHGHVNMAVFSCSGPFSVAVLSEIGSV